MPHRRISDEQALLGWKEDPEAFGAFYRRHEAAVLGYMLRRTGDAELAADLTAEVFASALVASRRFKRGREPAVAWLFGIAHNVLGHSLRRRQVEARARRRLAMPVLELAAEEIGEIERLDAEAAVEEALRRLPADQAAAIRARVVDDLEYVHVARSLRCSQQVARKKVSRGLATLREEAT